MLYRVLNQTQWFSVNADLSEYLESTDAALLFSFLCSQHEFFNQNDKLVSHPKWGDGWFYLTVEKLEEKFRWGKKKQRNLVDLIIGKKLIECQSFGTDNKRHFRFTEESEKELMEVFGGFKKISADTLQKSLPIRSKKARPNSEQNKLESNDLQKNSLETEKPTTPLLYNYNIYTKEGGDPPISKPIEKEKFGEWVTLSKDEYQKLCADIGKQKVDLLIQKINLYIPNSDKRKKGYSDYSAAIRAWNLKDQESLSHSKAKGDPEQDKQLAKKIQIVFKNRNDITLGYNYIEFTNGPKANHLEFGCERFKEQCFNELNKRKIDYKELLKGF